MYSSCSSFLTFLDTIRRRSLRWTPAETLAALLEESGYKDMYEVCLWHSWSGASIQHRHLLQFSRSCRCKGVKSATLQYFMIMSFDRLSFTGRWKTCVLGCLWLAGGYRLRTHTGLSCSFRADSTKPLLEARERTKKPESLCKLHFVESTNMPSDH